MKATRTFIYIYCKSCLMLTIEIYLTGKTRIIFKAVQRNEQLYWAKLISFSHHFPVSQASVKLICIAPNKTGTWFAVLSRNVSHTFRMCFPSRHERNERFGIDCTYAINVNVRRRSRCWCHRKSIYVYIYICVCCVCRNPCPLLASAPSTGRHLKHTTHLQSGAKT